MESEGSLPHSQVPVTCPFPEPAESSPCPHFLKIHLNIILPSLPGSSKWSLPLGFPTKSCVLLSPISVTCSAHVILLDLITRTLLGEEYKSLSSSLCSFLHSPVTSPFLVPNILFNNLFSNTLPLGSFLAVSDQVLKPIPSNGRNNSSVYLNRRKTLSLRNCLVSLRTCVSSNRNKSRSPS